MSDIYATIKCVFSHRAQSQLLGPFRQSSTRSRTPKTEFTPERGFSVPQYNALKVRKYNSSWILIRFFFSKIKELIFFHLGKILNLYFSQNSRKKPVEDIRGNSDRTNGLLSTIATPTFLVISDRFIHEK